MPLAPGAALGAYRIISSVGSGGMGEVYRAHDARLGRDVALKILPDTLAGDADHRARFEREARAVAALNHPNIVTIYSTEQEGDVRFLTMELIEGRTVGQLIPSSGLSLDALLKIAIPLADAIGAAHQRGITHRDLKPANVMVTDEGRVKVLDFGLARLRPDSPVDGLAATVTGEPITGQGRILGTVAYMSPEQAQGLSVDARSDVFSIGVLLFEMATGRKPFGGESSMAMLSSIIKDPPESITALRPDLPREFGRVLRRCLAKDPEERYQTAKDLRNDLKLLKEESDTGATAAPAPPVRRTRVMVAGAIATAVIVAGLSWLWLGQRPTEPQAFAALKPMRRLTNTGTAVVAAISPDGRYVVHAGGDLDKPSLWMRQASTTSSVEIVKPAEGGYSGLTFSPDGESVFYVFQSRGNPTASLFKIALLGGSPRKVLDDAITAPTFSPNGSQIAFIRYVADGRTLLMLANADGANQRELASRAFADPYEPSRPAWSPDGRWVAVFAGEMPRQKSRIVLVDATTGAERPFSEPRFDYGGQLAWLGDGSALVFDAIERYGGRFNDISKLWYIGYPDATVRRLTPDNASYTGLTATLDGRTLLATRVEVRSDVWVSPQGGSDQARPVTRSSDGRAGAMGIDWTPDGRIVYSAVVQDSWEIFIANADGTNARQLTNEPAVDNQPRALADGKTIVHTSRAAGASDVHVRAIDLDSGQSRAIDTGGPIFRGFLHVKGDYLYFKVQEGNRLTPFRLRLGGGSREPVLARTTRLPAGFNFFEISPDGRSALGEYQDAGTSGVAVVPLDGIGTVNLIPYTYVPTVGLSARWSADGRAFEDLAMRNGVVNLWRFPLDGAAAIPLTTFTSDQIFSHRWSRDGKTLAMARGAITSDLVLIESDDQPRK